MHGEKENENTTPKVHHTTRDYYEIDATDFVRSSKPPTSTEMIPPTTIGTTKETSLVTDVIGTTIKNVSEEEIDDELKVIGKSTTKSQDNVTSSSTIANTERDIDLRRKDNQETELIVPELSNTDSNEQIRNELTTTETSDTTENTEASELEDLHESGNTTDETIDKIQKQAYEVNDLNTKIVVSNSEPTTNEELLETGVSGEF